MMRKSMGSLAPGTAMLRTSRWLFAISLLSCAAAANAGPAKPHVKEGTPYPEARVELIRQGFDPVRIVSWDTFDHRCFGQDICAVYRELLQCAADTPACEFLYRRRSDGRYWVVGIRGEADKPTVKAMRGLRYDGAGPAGKGDLSGLVVIGPNGRRVTFPDG